jgi:HEAT repeat protein
MLTNFLLLSKIRKIAEENNVEEIEKFKSGNIKPLGLIRIAHKLTPEQISFMFKNFEIEKKGADFFKKKSRPDLAKILLDNGELSGLHAVFTTALENNEIAEIFKQKLAEGQDFYILRKTAASVPGYTFNRDKAFELLKDNLKAVRELTGDPDWSVRYFTIQILLNSDDDLSIRAVKEMAYDSNSFIRKTIADTVTFAEEKDTYNLLYDLLINDPVFEVRQCAALRIRKDFPQLHAPDTAALTVIQQRHLLELLDKNNPSDCDIALKFLESDNDTLNYYAALFLTKNGELEKMLHNLDIGDSTEFDRDYKLMENACKTGLSSFLNSVLESESPASMEAAAALLETYGNPSIILPLKKKIENFIDFSFRDRNHISLYKTIIITSALRNQPEGLKDLSKDLLKRKDNKYFCETVLPLITDNNYSFFKKNIEKLLLDSNFCYFDQLMDTIVNAGGEIEIPMLLSIIKGSRNEFTHEIKIRALKTLGAFEKSCYMQDILEYLYILPHDEAKDFAPQLVKFGGKDFDECVANILESTDARLKASVIAALPAAGRKKFIKEIETGLTDAAPEIRSASAWSLVDFKSAKSYDSIYKLLRDPVESVRIKAASAVAETATDKSVKELDEILAGKNESPSVIKSVIAALKNSSNKEAVNILIKYLHEDYHFYCEISHALTVKTSTEEIKLLIEHFKDADEQERVLIKEIFIKMKEAAEPAVSELLFEDIMSLKESIIEIAENSGLIESTIRKLTNKTPEVRREAAEFLSEAGSYSAFRGIILASRDPDIEVRKLVTKAVERLQTAEGEALLKQLQEDPSRKIRRYTAWALERLEAKKL